MKWYVAFVFRDSHVVTSSQDFFTPCLTGFSDQAVQIGGNPWVLHRWFTVWVRSNGFSTWRRDIMWQFLLGTTFGTHLGLFGQGSRVAGSSPKKHPQRLTTGSWKWTTGKRRFQFFGKRHVIFRFHVHFQGCTFLERIQSATDGIGI